MPHYDGPAFNRSHHPHSEYQAAKPAQRPTAPAAVAPAYQVDPFDALQTPASVATRRQHQVDYEQIRVQLAVDPAQLYVLATPDDQTPWATDQTPPQAEPTPNASETPVVDALPAQPEPAAATEMSTEAAKPTVSSVATDLTDDESEAITSQTESQAASTSPVPQLTTASDAAQADLDAQISANAAAASTEDQRPATVTELVAKAKPEPAAQPRHHGTRPNPFAVRASVRDYLKMKKAAAKAAKGNPPAAQVAGAQPLPSSQPGRQAEPVAQVAAATAATTPVAPLTAAYQLPPLNLLSDPVHQDTSEQQTWVAQQTETLNAALASFNVEAQVVASTVGPTVTQFQIKLAPGVKVNKITNLTDDLKLALAAKDIRIEAPIPGKSTVGIEIPNRKPRPVMLKEVLAAPAFQTASSPLTIALGVDLFGKPVVTNLAKMPHGLIAGATGAGKSVFINSLITSLLYKATPRQVRLLLIDPKAVELAVYNGLPHLVAPVVSDPKAASAALKWAVGEMEARYEKMAAANVRSLAQFNDKARAHGDDAAVMPSIVIIIDELADLMMVAASEVQDYIARITAKARAAGIHLIVATQRPSVDVITGTIKNNIPTRIAFMVASQVDSRTIIDHAGAETLLGRGDMLFLGNGASQPIRLQGTFIDRELDAITDFVRNQQPPQYLFNPSRLVAKAQAIEAQDELFPQVLSYVASEQTVSTSQLQRKFAIGYNRAAKLIDELEMRHYVSPANGSKPRDVYLNKEDLPQPQPR
ncbi:DNA translocase FtsK [Lacticaseibacillus salsurivasis]|uniref:DNA translocase FtsK n=1 Tax=Lacticaseibacillus salsurivasis TaxID=3081441 RepID=UPI0030C73079